MVHGRRWLIGTLVVGALAAALALTTPGGQESVAAPGQTRIYVDADAQGPTHDGSTWDFAFTELQDALGMAGPGDQIWVAAGTYTPTWLFDEADPRSATFQMENGVAIYGGFDPTIGDIAWEDRDWVNHETILSGDLNGDDVPPFGNNDENSYHVLYHPDTIALDSTAVLDGFTITGGNANGSGPRNRGGGMYNHNSNPTLTNVTFHGNSADLGGGMSNYYSSSPTLTNVTFQGNSADLGGGMFNSGSNPTLTNVAFRGNSATDGGGMNNQFSSTATLTYVTFRGNSAAHGGGMFNAISSPTLTHVTFAGNSADLGGGMANLSDSPTLTNVTFHGNSATENGGGMYNEAGSSPTLSNCILWDNSAIAGNQIYNNSSTPAIAYSDVQDSRDSSDVWDSALGIDGGGNIDADPLFVDAVAGDLRLQLTSPVIDAGDNTAVPLGITTDLGGHPRFVDVPTVPDTGTKEPGDDRPLVDLGAYEAPPPVIYVDASAGITRAQDGTAWAGAFTDLQDALSWAVPGVEIWVAEGTYKPTGTSDRGVFFELQSSVALYGGFAGTEDSRDQRDWATHVTVLSGDIGTAEDATDNSYHVVYSSGVTETAILDGFTISGGNANGDSWPDWDGGGMYNVYSSSPALTDVTFSGNQTVGHGGGMHNLDDSCPTLTNCLFINNVADSDGSGSGDGGGMSNEINSSPVLSGTHFLGNTANNGGGMHSGNESNPELTNVSFGGNTAAADGGGMHNYPGSSPALNNVTFIGNTAGVDGGGMSNGDSSPTLTNVTFSGNQAARYGGGIYNWQSSPTLTNCILWGDTAGGLPEEIFNSGSGSTPVVIYSDIQGDDPYPGTGNINADPLFVDAANGDYHLGPCSPCIDRGNNDAPDLPSYDFEGDDRILDGDGDGTATVDMGVDEALWHPVYLPLVIRD